MQFITKDESTHYSLIGEAYAYGIMNGKLMKSIVSLREYYLK